MEDRGVRVVYRVVTHSLSSEGGGGGGVAGRGMQEVYRVVTHPLF